VGPDPKQLERPIWSALTTTHASFALGNDLARRYPPDISPMAAVRDVSEDPCLQSLTKLLAPGDVVGLFSTEPVPADRNLAVIAQKVVDQMVYERGEAAHISGVVVKLTPADVPEMLHLAELTKPGPFAARTIALGSASAAAASWSHGGRTDEVRWLHRNLSGVFTSRSPWARAFILAC